MKNKLRKKLAALAMCGVMMFSGSSSALADSPAGEINEETIVQEQVLDIEADTEVLTEENVIETPVVEQVEEIKTEVTEDISVE